MGGLVGTTSACAENTTSSGASLKSKRNYLRVRGEYLCTYPTLLRLLELPPRARRIPDEAVHDQATRGTTSACAENTGKNFSLDVHCWNYLRVRGEYLAGIKSGSLSKELPPRARRIQLKRRLRSRPQGTTSACAENTERLEGKNITERNYLRVRGEYPH